MLAQMEASMRALPYFMSPQDLWALVGSAAAPRVIDVRRQEIVEASRGLLPGASWCDPRETTAWADALDRHKPVVVACKEGHERSQMVAADLRERSFAASVLAGGYKAWSEAGLPLVSKAACDKFAKTRPSRWVTRRRPKIDRMACPWLIRRFIDPDARFLFVDPPEVAAVARETGAVPFDIDGVELSHEGERCSFDTILKIFGLESEASLARLAPIVRGADTARPDLAPEAAGLLAVSLGLSAQAGDNDHGLLEYGFVVYDALYAWLRFAAEERHNWPAQAA
jgi:rhodanese-related sulfurtransferase